MSTDPKMTHVREVGRTTDPHRFAVKVERTVWLDPLLTEITGRSTGRIHLVAHDGFGDAQVWHLDPEQAERLIAGLENAVEDLAEAARWTTTTDPRRTEAAETNGDDR